MRKLILTGIAGSMAAAAVAAGPSSAAGPSQLIVAMRDPGLPLVLYRRRAESSEVREDRRSARGR